jgi:hypothetical protein
MSYSKAQLHAIKVLKTGVALERRGNTWVPPAMDSAQAIDLDMSPMDRVIRKLIGYGTVTVTKRATDGRAIEVRLS